ncbi:pseudouridine-5'-phosphate glycosidase [Natronincola ferrireducens]|nr:pseudouridine-5'-phosphate glycosidase [Natronincola ferrireducens]
MATIKEIPKDKSLEANIPLVYSNDRVGTQFTLDFGKVAGNL